MIKKNLTNYFVNSKSCSTFAPAFRKGVKFTEKIGLKKFFKKDLVNWKKGCTFAPAKKTAVDN